MVSIKITGGQKIEGEILISGAKNASMPIIIASLLSKKKVTLSNVPFVTDVTTLLSLIMDLGTSLEVFGDGRVRKVITLETANLNFKKEVGVMATKIRTSVLLIGPLLARSGYVKILKPGGCNIGERKTDLHVLGMEALGAKVLETDEYLELTTEGERLKAADFTFPKVSVGATENLIMAMVLAKGTSFLRNIAIEPEIEDLISFLNMLGANITKVGERELKIEGVEELDGGEYMIMPDRMEALTYAMMAAVTGGSMLLENISVQHLNGGVEYLEKIGMVFEDVHSGYPFGSVKTGLKEGVIKAIDIETNPFPGFATDLQPQLTVMMLFANEPSYIKENIFENRFRHVQYLQKMGARLEFEEQNKIKIYPATELIGTEVEGTDLRACAALLMAGLMARGETTMINAESVDRGYYNFVKNLNSCGAILARSS